MPIPKDYFDTSPSELFDNHETYVIATSLWACLNIAGVVCNVMLLIVLCKLKTKRTSYFALVKSLTVNDVLLPLFNLTIIVLYDRHFKHTIVLEAVEKMKQFSVYAILNHLIMLASEHFVAIIKPLHYQNWCRHRYIIARLLLIWITPFLLVVAGQFIQFSRSYKTYMHFAFKKTKSGRFLPYVTDTTGHNWSLADTFHALLAFLCLLVMSVVYSCIYCIIHKQQRRERAQNQHSQKNYRALVTTILNLASFLVSWMPFASYEISLLISPPRTTTSYKFGLRMKMMLSYVVCLNSLCDPLIYAIRLTGVRQVWRRTFCHVSRPVQLKGRRKKNNVQCTKV